MARYLLLLALAGLLALTGCGSSSKSSSSAASKSSSAKEAANNGTLGKITMNGIAFHPKQTTVKVGRKVTWTNEEAVQHNVTATKGASFKSQLFGQGKTFSYTPKK